MTFVIPGRCAASNPEIPHPGLVLTHQPGMTLVFLAEPRHLETSARRPRRRADRHQRSNPARPGLAAAADQPRGNLARQGRPRSRHCRLDRSDPARKSKGAGQRHDAARQRADLGVHPSRPRLRGEGRSRPREAGLCRGARRSGFRRRQQGQPGHREGSPVAADGDAPARAAHGDRSAAAAPACPPI